MKYNNIIETIMCDISKGKIGAGMRLPSIRQLCDRFYCSKSTAVRAYSELKERGVIYAIPNSGYYLIEKYSMPNNDDDVLDFSGTSIDDASLPYRQIQPFFNQAINKYKDELFSYSDPQGLKPLVKTIKDHLEIHQVFSNNDRIYITTGSQQALDILARMPLQSGKQVVAIEQPTYEGMIQSLKLNGIKTIGINRGINGLDFDGLEKAFSTNQIKFFYTVTRYSNPLGYCYTKDEKHRLLSLANRYDVFIIEDDYLGDLEDDNKTTPIYSYDKNDRVVYIKTFSKILLPGIRVASVVLPKVLIDTFKKYKYWSDLNTPLVSQGTLEIYLTSGFFTQHVKKMKAMYKDRMIAIQDVQIRSSCTNLWSVPSNGFYASIKLDTHRASTVAQRLKQKDILLTNIKSCYLSEFYKNDTIRISIVNADVTSIQRGINTLIKEIG